MHFCSERNLIKERLDVAKKTYQEECKYSFVIVVYLLWLPCPDVEEGRGAEGGAAAPACHVAAQIMYLTYVYW